MMSARSVAGLAGCLVLVCAGGCAGLIANLIHMGTGNKVPAQYTGLQNKRVAVVCVSNAATFGPSSASVHLARQVSELLARNVSKIQLVDQQRVSDWIDSHNWDQVDYLALGRGVGAQLVVAVDLDSFSLYEATTVYKGRADVQLVVHDIEQNGKVVFDSTPPQIQYPHQAGFYTSELTEREFRTRFLAVVAHRIARHFYSYELKENFAQDTTLIAY